MRHGQVLIPLLLLSAIACSYGAVRTRNQFDRPGAKSFLLVLTCAIGWSVTYAVALLSFEANIRIIFEALLWVWKAIMPVAWIVFALEYTGRVRYLSRPVVALLSLSSVITVALAATNGAHNLVWQSYSVVDVGGVAAASYLPGPWLYWQVGWGYLLIGGGIILLLEAAVTNQSLYARQVAALALGTLAPTAANVAWLVLLNDGAAVDFSPLAFSLTGVLFGYALFRHDLFTLTPATWREGHRTAIDDFGSGVIILDTEGRVVDINDAMEEEFELQDESVDGVHFQRLFGLDELDLSGDTQTVTLRTATEVRTFSVNPSDISDRHGRRIGYILTLHDVTEQQLQRQRVEVFDRILRHNLRNKLTVILGNAEYVQDQRLNGSCNEVEQIRTASNELAALSERARSVERLVAHSPRPEQIPAHELRETLGMCDREFNTDRAVVFQTPDDECISADPYLLSTIIGNSVAAIRTHGTKERPVAVTLTRRRGTWRLTFSDSETMIPTAVQESILTGQETQLQHGLTLDLWLVAWSVQKMGGELTFTDEGREITVEWQAEGVQQPTTASGKRPRP